MARYSLSTTIVSILAIFIVIMIAITDIENSSIRKTFSPNSKNEKNSQNTTDNSASGISLNDSTTIQALNEKQTTDISEKTSIPTPPSLTDKEIIYSGSGNPNFPVLIKDSEENSAYLLNFEKFKKAGLSSFLMQKKPFIGMLFDTEFKELTTLDVNQQVVVSSQSSDRSTIVETWEIKGTDSSMSDEVYNLLKNKFLSSLEVSVNETNQFGQQSFYVNFEGKDANTFLVVKQYNSVYALSYLKDYHNLIKAFFKLV